MAMKEWLAWLPPPRSLLALMLGTAGFGLRLAASHVTHSPTLLVDTCHSLCRLVGLITTVIAFKYERADEGRGRETKLRNTFGWARIEVVGRLSVHVLFASFGLALLVNALQLGVHSSHGQPPRNPKVTIGCAVVGLLLHAIGYLLLAGRELSYGRRLSVTESGGVVLKSGGRIEVLAHAPADITSSLFVMAAGLTAEWAGPTAKLADPAMSAVASIILVLFNYPFMREAGLVLLQTVPEGLGACALRAATLRVPGVLAIHELHVWQLYQDQIVATAHVFYSSQEDYLKSSAMVAEVFKRHGISLVTLQPEFADITEDSEQKSLLSRANEACGRPCAAHCTAPRCCKPTNDHQSDTSTHTEENAIVISVIAPSNSTVRASKNATATSKEAPADRAQVISQDVLVPPKGTLDPPKVTLEPPKDEAVRSNIGPNLEVTTTTHLATPNVVTPPTPPPTKVS